MAQEEDGKRKLSGRVAALDRALGGRITAVLDDIAAVLDPSLALDTRVKRLRLIASISCRCA